MRDGTITWTETEFEVVHLAAGEISGSSFQVGNVVLEVPLQLTGGLTLDRLTYGRLSGDLAPSERLSPPDGTQIYCTDCDTPGTPGAACSSSRDKAGAEAHKVRGTWKCF